MKKIVVCPLLETLMTSERENKNIKEVVLKSSCDLPMSSKQEIGELLGSKGPQDKQQKPVT